MHECYSDDEKDILKEGLGENYKRVKKEALDILAKCNGKVCKTQYIVIQSYTVVSTI